MDRQEYVKRIIDKEWPMFSSVNGDDKTSCQNDRPGFIMMRRAQFTAWSESALAAYLDDLAEAEANKKNLAREKYIRMMETTDPKAYEAFKSELPEVSDEKSSLITEIWSIMCEQTKRMRDKYPAVAAGGRPFLISDEIGSYASVENYQISELSTYSERTLRLLLEHIKSSAENGTEIAFEIQLNTMKELGYPDIDTAEKDMAYRYIQQLGGGACESCGALGDRCYV